MKRILRRSELVALARKLGVRPDWHEPDEQEVDAVVRGNNFDNAGFWPEPVVRDGKSVLLEKHVVLRKAGKPVAVVNLATLFAWACGLQD